ncbi:MAG: MarR family transcriptional regulator [Pseudomonadaceae bacterium]|nr:MarR family transcriptional regulator [Pseudomonadaceae bacterium]
MPQRRKPLANNPYLQPMQSMGYLSRVNFRMFSRALEKLTLPHGVSSGQWRLLRVLWEEDNITQRELSERTGTKEATTVHAVRSLVEAGFAQRTRCSKDKRKFYITLTPEAHSLRATLMPKVATINEIALAGIDAGEVDIARKVLAKTYANLCDHLGEMNV